MEDLTLGGGHTLQYTDDVLYLYNLLSNATPVNFMKKDLNLKTLRKNIVQKILSICLGNDLLDTIPKAQATKAKIDQWDYIKAKISAQKRKQSTK